MDFCVVDKLPETFIPPHRQAIEDAKQRQLDALKALRRLLVETRPGKLHN